jgi:hypothetical protein
MPRASRGPDLLPAAALLTAGLLCLSACGDDDLNGINPRLVVEGATADATSLADWVVDFGEVGVGSTGRRSLTVTNLGKSTLALDAIAVEAPFAVYQPTAEVRLNQRVQLEFEFAPAAVGAATFVATLRSDGGTTTVRLAGTGVEGAGCQLTPRPAALDFQSVSLGEQKALPVTLANTGRVRCSFTATLAAASNAAFTLPSPPSGQVELAPAGELVLDVLFKPTVAVNNQLGAIDLDIEGAEPQRIALTGNAIPVARETVYVNNSTTLFTYDTAAGVTTRIGSFRVGSTNLEAMTDIAIDNAGNLFGAVANSTRRQLYSINPETAECVLLGNIGHVSNGLTFLPDGRLISAADDVLVLDPLTGQTLATLVPATRNFKTSGDIIALPDGKLYWAVKAASGSSDRLVQIDPSKPVASNTTVAGDIGTTNVYGLGYADGVLYGFTSAGTSVEIDPATGASSRTRTMTGQSYWGATTNPARW